MSGVDHILKLLGMKLVGSLDCYFRKLVVPEVDCTRNHMQVRLSLSGRTAHSNCSPSSAQEEGPASGSIEPVQLVSWYHSPHNKNAGGGYAPGTEYS